MAEQKQTKPPIEDYIRENYDGDPQRVALDFIAFLRANKMPPGKSSEYASCKGERICKIQFGGPGCRRNSWAVCLLFYHIDKYEEQIKNEGLQNIFWDNVVYCVHGSGRPGTGCSPNKPCAGGETRNILGREIDGICRLSPGKSTKIWDPDESAVSGIKKLLLMEQKAREKNPFTHRIPLHETAERTSGTAEDIALYMEQHNIRREIADEAGEHLEGDRLTNLLSFAAWLRANKLPPVWTNWRQWTVNVNGKSMCNIRVIGNGVNAGSWHICFYYSEDKLADESLVTGERLREVIWANVKPCNNCAGCGVKQIRTIVGKQFENACNLDFWNPGAEEMECAMQLIMAKRGV